MLKRFLLITCLTIGLTSCAGYSNKIASPFNIKSIYVPTVTNQIPLESMIIYVPGMEVDITNAVINRFNFDGTLKVVSRPEDADAILHIQLRNFFQEGARFTRLESVEEYRLFLTTRVKLKDSRTDETLLLENRFLGKTTYFRKLSTFDQRGNSSNEGREPIAVPLRDATDRAILDLANNLVDLVTEAW